MRQNNISVFLVFPRVKVYVVPTEDGSSAGQHVLTRLEDFEHEEDDERWLLLDTDHYVESNHVGNFVEVIKQAHKKGISIALSNPCFELWLLLHHEEEKFAEDLKDCADTVAALRAKLGGYNKTRLRSEHYSLPSVVAACQRAERLDASVAGGGIPDGTTTRVYQLVKAIVASALPSQLPEQLRALKQ
jgi:RloB-like protein